MKRLIYFGFVLVLAAVTGCSDPASKAPKAVVGNQSPTSSSAAVDDTKAEKLPITSTNSQISFIGSKVTGSENGSFKDFSGAIYLVDGKPEKSRVTIDIKMDSVQTDSSGLSTHLKTPDFFDVAKFPTASFSSTEIKQEGGGDQITGMLDLHGIKKTISFPARINVAASSVSVESEFSINRKDFGINYPGKANDLIRENVVLKLKVAASRASR